MTKGNSTKVYPYGNQRVTKFVDFVNGHPLPYDDNGHGSHVSGIILGNGYDSFGLKSGVAPKASLISLKVLDANGVGTISNIIAALNWVAVNHTTYNIRVVNMSVGARVLESFWTDPLTLAASRPERHTSHGGGQLGKRRGNNIGGISAPANAPGCSRREPRADALHAQRERWRVRSRGRRARNSWPARPVGPNGTLALLTGAPLTANAPFWWRLVPAGLKLIEPTVEQAAPVSGTSR